MKPIQLIFLALSLSLFQVSFAQEKPKHPILPNGIRAVWDVPYIEDGHERQKLDIYLPEKTQGKHPLVVCVHGGGWEAGSKDAYDTPVVAAYLASRGYVVACVNYRLSQHAVFPAQLEDCKAAIRWLRANAAKYHIDRNHVGAWGHSAGGHLVALLGTTSERKSFDQSGGNTDQSSKLQCVVDWCGPTDLTAKTWRNDGPKSLEARLIGGTLPKHIVEAQLASPIIYASKYSAPFLIVHGDSDNVVELSQSERFAEALNRAGAEATLYVVKGGGHGGGWFNSQESMELIANFMDKHLKNKPKLATVSNNSPNRHDLPGGVQAFWDLPYVKGGHERNRLNIYLPEKAKGRMPLMVWIHGGGLIGGSKDDGNPAVRLTSQGYVVASIEYRLCQYAAFPAQIEDCKAAIRWLRANAAKYHINPECVGVWGESAGGQLVGLLGTRGDHLEWDKYGDHQEQSSRVQCVVDWFGVADYVPYIGDPVPLFDVPEVEYKTMAREASGIYHVSNRTVPFLFMHGDSDACVELDQSERFAKTLREAGIEVILKVIKGAGHGGPEFETPENKILVDNFLKKHLKK
jgi:acetyl esterase/lipase